MQYKHSSVAQDLEALEGTGLWASVRLISRGDG